MNHFENVTSKRNKWYWYLLVLILCFAISNTIGAIPLYMLIIVYRISHGTLPIISSGNLGALGFNLNLTFVAEVFPFVITLIAVILLIMLIHGRSWKEVINGTNRVRWSRFFFGCLIWGIISLILFVISYFSDPEVFTFRFDPVNFFILLIIALLFVPFQASTEEFLFRGYIAQGVASWTKSRWCALIIPAIIFGLMHSINPEVREYGLCIMMSHYIFFGLMFSFMSIMDDGIELAMGVHTVNNLFGTTFVTYKASALQTYALFELTEFNPADDIIPFIISGIALVAICAYKYKWNLRIINRKIEYGVQL